MNDREILEKAIQKAIDGGYQHEPVEVLAHTLTHTTVANYSAINGLIFNHEFAKALWGEDIIMMAARKHANEKGLVSIYVMAWMGHLQQMVIADDPINYLGDNL